LKGIADSIDKELTELIGQLCEITEERDLLDYPIRDLEKDIKRLKVAWDALNGTETTAAEESSGEEVESVSSDLQVKSSPQALPPPPKPIIPPGSILCNSCDGLMQQQARTLQSGRTVTLWVCGECSNERV